MLKTPILILSLILFVGTLEACVVASQSRDGNGVETKPLVGPPDDKPSSFLTTPQTERVISARSKRSSRNGS